MAKYTHIIWDWNGTLLDDVEICIESANKMLKKRGLKLCESVDEYRSIFGFPVIEYYVKLGFDFEKETFEALSEEYMANYHGNGQYLRLHKGAREKLAEIKAAGIKQIIVSASKTEHLNAQISLFDIENYFDKILGISDIYAASKVDIALKFLESLQADGETHRRDNLLLIGDTLHDYEVAKAIGCDCLLIANGHQSREILEACGVAVIDNIEQVGSFVF